MRTSRIVGGAAAVLVAAGSIVAFTSGGGGTDHLSSASADRDIAATKSLTSGGTAAGPGALALGADTAATPAPVAAPGRSNVAPAAARVVKTASLTLAVGRNNVTKVAAAVSHAAERQGGYVAETERETGDAQSATLTVRVPAATYDATLTQLRKLGTVKSESLGGRDVTGTLVDLDARLRSLRAQEQALNALMAKANTVGETLQVAQSVGEVRGQIEQLAAQQAQLADRADFATITVSVLGPHAALETSPRTDPLLVASFKRAGAASLAVFGGVIVVLGLALPMGLLAAIGYGVWRLVNRRRSTTTSAPPAVA